MNFYTNQSVITMFRVSAARKYIPLLLLGLFYPVIFPSLKAYVAHLLNHVNKYTGVVLKDEPTILAWETGNELQQQGQPFTNWTDSLAAYIKETLGAKQLVMDGRANEKSPDPLALANPHVDIMSDHYYMAWDQAIQLAIADGADAAVNNKVECPGKVVGSVFYYYNPFFCHQVFIVGEYGAAASNATAIAPLLNEFETNNNISGDVRWHFFERRKGVVGEGYDASDVSLFFLFCLVYPSSFL